MYFTNSTFKKSSAFARKVTFVPGVERNNCSQLFRFSTSQFLKGLIFWDWHWANRRWSQHIWKEYCPRWSYAVKVDMNPWEKANVILYLTLVPLLHWQHLKRSPRTFLPYRCRGFFMPQVRFVIGSHSLRAFFDETIYNTEKFTYSLVW